MDRISKTLLEREEFLERLEKDLEKNFHVGEEVQKYIKKLADTVSNIKELGKEPEHVALIPLANNIYINGKIVHTGEYLVEKKAYPDSYTVLQTLGQTVKYLEEKASEQKDSLKKVETAQDQLKERVNLMSGISSLKLDDSEEIVHSEVTDDMPQQIHSDKGVAVKVGDFYEIMEYEN